MKKLLIIILSLVICCSFCYAGKDQKISEKQTIIISIKNAFDKRNYIELKDSVELFHSKYPNSSRNTEFRELLIKMSELAFSEAMKKENEKAKIKGIKRKSQYITLGMTKSQVRSIKGDPIDINKHVGSWGIHEQWVYNRSYLYFENGILTSWQN